MKNVSFIFCKHINYWRILVVTAMFIVLFLFSLRTFPETGGSHHIYQAHTVVSISPVSNEDPGGGGPW